MYWSLASWRSRDGFCQALKRGRVSVVEKSREAWGLWSRNPVCSRKIGKHAQVSQTCKRLACVQAFGNESIPIGKE